MKKILLSFALLVLAASAHATVQQVLETLPSSDDTTSAVYVSSAVTPLNVTVSSATNIATQLDAAMLASCNTALGATYKRASVTIQNTGTTNFSLGYAPTGWTTATGGHVLYPGDVWSYQIGKGILFYGISIPGSAGTAAVGGFCYK